VIPVVSGTQYFEGTSTKDGVAALPPDRLRHTECAYYFKRLLL